MGISIEEVEFNIRKRKITNQSRQVTIKHDNGEKDYYLKEQDAADTLKISIKSFRSRLENPERFLECDETIVWVKRYPSYKSRKKYKPLFEKMQKEKEENREKYSWGDNYKEKEYRLKQYRKWYSSLSEKELELYDKMKNNELNGSAQEIHATDLKGEVHKFNQKCDFCTKFKIPQKKFYIFVKRDGGFSRFGVKNVKVFPIYRERPEYSNLFNRPKWS